MGQVLLLTPDIVTLTQLLVQPWAAQRIMQYAVGVAAASKQQAVRSIIITIIISSVMLLLTVALTLFVLCKVVSSHSMIKMHTTTTIVFTTSM